MLQRQNWNNRTPLVCSSLFAYSLPGNHGQSRHQSNSSASRVPVVLPLTLRQYTTIRAKPSSISTSKRYYSTSHQTSCPAPFQKHPSFEGLVVSNEPTGNEAVARNDRGGNIRVGARAKYTQHKRTNSQVRQNYGPWPGLKVLRLGTGQLLQSSHSEYAKSCPPSLSEWSPREDLAVRLRFPWLSRIGKQHNGGSLPPAHLRLNDELKAYQEYVKPTELEKTAATNAWIDMKAIIAEGLDQQARIHLIGSRASGMDGPTSDLDINVQFHSESGSAEDLNHVSRRLRGLDRHLRRLKFRDSIARDVYLPRATVPIISGTHIPSGLEFQIQSTTTVYDSLEVARAFLAEYPSACALFKIVKQMLMMRNLTRGQSGGVTSYPLLNMVVASLKLSDSFVENHDLATQLLHFLKFWSQFDFGKNKIIMGHLPHVSSVSQEANHGIDPISAIPRVVPKDTETGKTFNIMSLEDPADPSNDLGRNTFNIGNVQACFTEAHHQLRQSMQNWDALGNIVSSYAELEPILAWCLGGDYTVFEEARWQLYKYGSRIANADA